MEKAFATGNSRALYQLIRSTGPRKATVSETIGEKDGSLIHSQKRRLERWAEHFEEQFSWPPATQPVEIVHTGEWNVNLDRPSEEEIRYEIAVLEREKAPGPDGLYPALFKEGGNSLVTHLTKLIGTMWDEEKVPAEWGMSTVIPIFKKGARTLCDNHHVISLLAVASKVLSGLILRRLTEHRERQIRENQAGFRPARGCIDHIFTLRQILEQRHCFQQPTMVVFLGLKAAFDSVDRQALWQCLWCKGVPHKFLTLIKALYANSSGRVKVYGKLSPESTTSNGVRHGCPLSPFLFNFVIDTIMEDSLPASNARGVEVLPGPPLTDIEYADDIALLGSDPVAMQTILNNLNNSASRFGMRFTPAKCKVLLQDWVGSNPNLMLADEPIEVVDKFVCVDSCISPGGLAKDDISIQIGKQLLQTYVTCGVGVTSASLSGSSLQCCGALHITIWLRNLAAARRGRQKTQCLTIDVFGALPESGGNTGSAILKVDVNLAHHVAGGQHSGIVVNKGIKGTDGMVLDVPEMQLEFTCIMFNKRTSETHAENRRLKFWFTEGTQQIARLNESYSFFQDLVNPDVFPRDYAGFIKKILDQLHGSRFPRLRRVDLDLVTLDPREQEALVPERDKRPPEQVIREAIQMRLEEAYPNVLSMEDLVRILEIEDRALLKLQLEALQERDLIQLVPLEGKNVGQLGFRRKIHLQNQDPYRGYHHCVEIAPGLCYKTTALPRQSTEQFLICFSLSSRLHPHLKSEVKEVKEADHMKRVSTSEKPTIAIITNLLCEKLAVDAMIEQKTTFVRYKTEGGESNVYTIGNIGPHRVISTKLAMVGRELQAKISSASITTRLLGRLSSSSFESSYHVPLFIKDLFCELFLLMLIPHWSTLPPLYRNPSLSHMFPGAFQTVQHVFLVGVGGSVPHVYEFEKHSRLGDVVVSAPVRSSNGRSPMGNGTHSSVCPLDVNKPGDPVYIYCDHLIERDPKTPKSTPFKFVLKRYEIRDSTLLNCVDRVLDRFESDPSNCQWAQILTSCTNAVGEHECSVNFSRPPPETDKLKLKIDEGVRVDIKHPEIPEDLERFYPPGIPAVRLGCFGSGRPITDNDKLRDFFAKEHQLLSYDSEYDQVLESVLGNGLNSFLIIRGMADYVEGRQDTQWQPYAALAAASFMKAVILELPSSYSP
ncbi:hypothetical protein T265_09726 [Opisthorchis viverrini]|uniref:Reverse transcriptase domain-containing protein n=1 Tax=Opisthorchis viverrini TaxID=6198 RepID=A0A074Z4X0_OPIVI|nr:hypothetical protein T265_09726 [Opisthorchis viverrini]KER22108.1 hypothetical protein T265_09726 [Opisthorchis viverrini]